MKTLDELGPDIIIPKNEQTIPMYIPLSVALVQKIQERGISLLSGKKQEKEMNPLQQKNPNILYFLSRI